MVAVSSGSRLFLWKVWHEKRWKERSVQGAVWWGKWTLRQIQKMGIRSLEEYSKFLATFFLDFCFSIRYECLVNNPDVNTSSYMDLDRYKAIWRILDNYNKHKNCRGKKLNCPSIKPFTICLFPSTTNSGWGWFMTMINSGTTILSASKKCSSALIRNWKGNAM